MRKIHLYFRESAMVLLAFLVFYFSFVNSIEHEDILLAIIAILMLFYVCLIIENLFRKYKKDRQAKIIPLKAEENSNYRMMFLIFLVAFFFFLMNLEFFYPVLGPLSQMETWGQISLLSLMLLFFLGVQPHLDKFLEKLEKR